MANSYAWERRWSGGVVTRKMGQGGLDRESAVQQIAGEDFGAEKDPCNVVASCCGAESSSAKEEYGLRMGGTEHGQG